MFFILSKTLDFLLSPFIWALVILLYAFFSKRSGAAKRKIYLAGLIVLLFFSNSFIVNETFLAWEGRPESLNEVKNYEVGIVLTGVASSRKGVNDRVFFGKGADRVLHTVQLYRAGKIKRILISGGSSAIIAKTIPEADLLKIVFMYCGVPDSDILIENKSRNTAESSRYSKDLIESLKIDRDEEFLLITSAFHIPRSLGCFRKAGLNVQPYSVDFYAHDREFDLESLILPTAYALEKWSVLAHEICGFVIYKLMGYS